jgi:disulfide bond formation protein DsbB
MRVGAALDGAVTDLAYDPASDRFLLTTSGHGVYLLDGSLGRVLRHAVLDPSFSVELGELAGAAFVSSHDFVALGVNKSFAVLRESDRLDPAANYRFFLAGFDQFEELARGRFATVRARMMFVMSLAFDPGSDSFYTLTVPNSRHKRLIVSRFDHADMTLAQEYAPRLSATSGLALAGEKRSLDEYFVTGAAVEAGKLYALSAAYGTLLTLDLETREVVAAHAIEGLTAPTGLAVKGDELWVADASGRIVVVDKP